MPPSKGRTKDRAAKKRTAERISRPGVRSRVGQTVSKRANTPYRRQHPYDSISIPQLVYELLTIDKYNRDTRRSMDRFETPQRMRGHREQRRLSYGEVDGYNSSESIRVPEYMSESRSSSVESLTEVMDAANSSAPTSSANSSVSNISSMEPITLANSLNSARSLFKKKFLVDIVNNYIKAGIEEGKRQAKMYIRKALSLGVRSGYLVPADVQGSVLRVCPTLTSSRASNAESRWTRRNARRGDTSVLTIDERKAMRRGVPTGKTPRRDVSAEDTTTTSRRRRRYRKRLVAESSPRKSSERSRPREKNRARSGGARRNSKIAGRANGKQEQRRKRGDNSDAKKSVKRRRTALSPRRAEDNHEPVMESYGNASSRDRDPYNSNEDNYRVVTERRKPSRENDSIVEGQKSGANIEDRDVERRNVDDDAGDEKSEEASTERDANCTTGETDA